MAVVLTLILDGLAYGMILFIISVGLSMTMGLLRIINLAHGAFAMVGGYVAAALVSTGFDFFAATVIGAAAAGVCGALLEMTLYRPLYRKGALAQVLLTTGLAFVAIAGLTLLFGTSYMTVPIPAFLQQSIDIGFRHYPAYRLFLIGIGAAIAIALWLVVDRSLIGARLRAAVDNPQMARALGINVDRLFTVTFAAGSALAGLGGALGASILPLEAFYPLKYLVIFLVVVIVGGEGRLEGSLFSALALGMVDTIAKFFFPSAAVFVFFALVIAVLLWRPKGILRPNEA
jgi:branched-chain amino acid transport system permease protein